MDDEHAPNILSIFLLDFFQLNFGSLTIGYCATGFFLLHSLLHCNCLFHESYRTNTVWLLSFNFSTHVRGFNSIWLYVNLNHCSLRSKSKPAYPAYRLQQIFANYRTQVSISWKIDKIIWTIQSEKCIEYSTISEISCGLIFIRKQTFETTQKGWHFSVFMMHRRPRWATVYCDDNTIVFGTPQILMKRRFSLNIFIAWMNQTLQSYRLSKEVHANLIANCQFVWNFSISFRQWPNISCGLFEKKKQCTDFEWLTE